MNYLKTITHLALIIVFASSCKNTLKNFPKITTSKAYEKNSNNLQSLNNSSSSLPTISFRANNKNLDSNYIIISCGIVNSIQNKIPDNFAYIDFFQTYLQFKSYLPNHLNQFDCATKLEQQAFYLLALDRGPLEKIDYTSKVDDYVLHREVIRNLYKIVNVIRSKEGKILSASGINNGKLFDSRDEDFLKIISNPKSYLKFYSELDDSSGNYQESFIPIRNYHAIKEYLVRLNKSDFKKDSKKDSKKIVGGNFAISFSAMIHLISVDVMKNKEFAWIEEISSTPYYSVIHPLHLFVDTNKTLSNPVIRMGYSYNARMLKSGVVLAKIMKESGIVPKAFSVMPIIEKSLRSGSKEYCGTITQPQDLLIVEKLHATKLQVPKSFIKYCFGNVKNTTPNGNNRQTPINNSAPKYIGL